MQDLQGKVAVVTGAASGIGRALALDFARNGCSLVLADIEAAPLQAVKQEVAALGAKVHAQVTDVSKLDSVQALASAAYRQFPGVHILCNNAGVATWGGLEQATHQDWQWVLGVNLWGVIHGVEAFIPRMVAQAKAGTLGEGHVVNTASMAGLIASQGLGVYNTSKYAVVGLSETLRKDLRDYRIGVSVLCPMGVSTRISESSRNRPPELASAPPPRGEGLLGEYLKPERVSALVLAAIKADQQYVLTHPESQPFLERRFARLQEAYQFLRSH
ncbi:MAG TPA: SDR family NAD(P)-dependent oxidoreductase [bacterium]|nr:SDR family NAD(P)-dependent oxidoreductase [bacterium]